MKKVEWPGITVAAICLLLFAISVAAGRDPNFMLKDWQTTLVASVAAVAAVFAYKSTMAKVDFDRDVAKTALLRERLGVYLRLRANLWLAHQFACDAILHIDSDERHMTHGMPLSDLGQIDTFDFDEAWQTLHFFPGLEAMKIANLRSNLRGLIGAIKDNGPAPIIPAHIQQIKQMLSRLSELSIEIQNWLNVEMKRM